MAPTYTDPNFKNRQTPGVFITEFDAFPQSVVGVKTAIPAFIGYTQTAVISGKSVKMQPVAISSMADYEQVFGTQFDPAYNIYELDAGSNQNPDFVVTLDGVTTKYIVAEDPTLPQFSLYYNMQMFYANGGSNCYVVSVGDYTSPSIAYSDLNDGLNSIANQIGPTMLVIPEAVNLKPTDTSTGVPQSTDFNTLINNMIAQCDKLQDRVAILDVYGTTAVTQTSIGQTLDTCVTQFYDGITTPGPLSYGMAYFPFLNTSIVPPSNINYTNFSATEQGSQTAIAATSAANAAEASLTAANEAKTAADAADKAVTDAITAVATTPLTATDLTTLVKAVDDAAIASAAAYADAETTLTEAIATQSAAEAAAKPSTATTSDATAKTSADTSATDAKTASDDAKAANDAAIAAKTSADALTVAGATSTALTALEKLTAATVTAEQKAAGSAKTENDAADQAIHDANAASTETMLHFVLTQFNDAQYPATSSTRAKVQEQIDQIDQAAKHDDPKVISLNNILMNALGQYSQLLQLVSRQAGVLPPSAAMAGIFTLNDQTRGVWNAPANLAPAATISPTVNLNDEQQGGLNVPLNGMAIDVIRNFVGRGPVVWGARTLDGNSQDWKYIQVRRTIIYVEQSIKTAINQFVFAPNVASTWVSVTQMVSGFLQGLWSQGGLMGNKASDAFTVQCGVPATMTGTDILNGYMVVQVTLQMVHPAEFIELTFKQTMQGS